MLKIADPGDVVHKCSKNSPHHINMYMRFVLFFLIYLFMRIVMHTSHCDLAAAIEAT